MSKKNDETGVRLGMWLFLYTEIMLFGGLFILYAAYYQKYTPDFVDGGKTLSLAFGTINTIILLCSSFSVAASITAVRQKSAKLAFGLLSSSVIMGIIFLVNKYFEWSHKFDLGIYPNSEILLEGSLGLNIFFGLYFLITGLHGLHVLIGIILLTICAIFVKQNRVNESDYILLDNCGLYWHLVDLIWIFVFPLFYLIV